MRSTLSRVRPETPAMSARASRVSPELPGKFAGMLSGYKPISINVPPTHGNDVAAFAVGDVLWNLRRLGGPHVSEQSRPLPNGGHCSVSVSREAPRRHINAAACDAVCFGIDPSGREKVCESVWQAYNGPHAPQQIVSPVLIARNTVPVHSSPSHRAKALSTRCTLWSSRCPMSGPTLSW